MSDLEDEIVDLRVRLDALAERVRLDAVALRFLTGDHAIREGDYFLLDGHFPTRLDSVCRGTGKWTYFNGRNTTEPFRIPDALDHRRLYTIEEVAEILGKANS